MAWRIVRETWNNFQRDECSRMAAALAFYFVFSLPALLLFTVTIAGFFVSRDDVSASLTGYFQQSLGRTGADQIETMLHQANRPGRGWLSSTIGLVILLFSAMGALSEMQSALNRIWKVPTPVTDHRWRRFFGKRLLSLAMLLSVAFLLLTSLILSWLLSVFGEAVQSRIPNWLSVQLLGTLHNLTSLAIITLLFAAIFQYVPDLRLAWRDVIAGAFLTAVLFVVGKGLLSYYFTFVDPASVFGAAGSLALVLLWIYYSALIVFLGAEFAHVTARIRKEVK